MRIVVVGGGIAGVSVAAELAADAEVVLLEAEPEPARHTTGRSAASYIPGHGSVPGRALIAASRERFDALADDAGFAFLRPRPVLLVAHADDEERALAHAAGVRRVGPAEACALWPALRREGLRGAAVVDDACDADPLGLHQHYRRRLRERGGTIRTGAPLTALAPTASGWRAGTAGEAVDADVVVLAAGAWTDRLLALAGAAPLGLRSYRRTIAVARVPAGAPVSRSDPFAVSAAEHWYTKPEGERVLVSPADETPDEPGDARPDELDVALALERVNAASTLRLRSVATSWAGLRTFAPDRVLVIGDRPEHRGLHVVAGQGGSGIETAPAAAALAAATVRGAPPPADVVTQLAAHGTGPEVFAATRLPAAAG